jgi:hypothetical protein
MAMNGIDPIRCTYSSCGDEIHFGLIPSNPALPVRTILLPSTQFNNEDGSITRHVLVRQLGTNKVTLTGIEDAAASGISLPEPNVRATTLAMACGLHSKRFYGDITIEKRFGFEQEVTSCPHTEVLAACVAPDMRQNILSEMSTTHRCDKNAASPNNEATTIPDFILESSASNYRDRVIFTALARAMKLESERMSSRERNMTYPGQSNGEVEGLADSDKDSDEVSNSSQSSQLDIENEREDHQRGMAAVKERPTLCLHCRQPATKLCPSCSGAYFCEGSRNCREEAWAHQCTCPTWRLYTKRRQELEHFDKLPWAEKLVKASFRTSELPYRVFLQEQLKVLDQGWWLTELEGWAAGEGPAARLVDMSIRKTYHHGFVHLPQSHIPSEEPVDFVKANSLVSSDERGLLKLKSWGDYYAVRQISNDSAVALLMTFPLTVYYAIQRYGEVPLTVARMLNRPLRVHVVGIEKELNFLDLFSEIGYLLPEDLSVSTNLCALRQNIIFFRCVEHNPSLKYSYSLFARLLLPSSLGETCFLL